MKENQKGKLLFSVEHAVLGGHHNIAFMAAMTTYWIHNFCVNVLEEMMVYCGKENNALAGNL